jgi:ubiquinone biosynthesis protein
VRQTLRLLVDPVVESRGGRSGSLGVDFRVRDADHSVDHLVDGLVTGASVVAGAQLIARRAGPTLAGVSIPGLVAAGVGVMIWQRLVARCVTTRTWVMRARDVHLSTRT